jgi:hypothetical protein
MPQAIRLVADSASARGPDAADNVVVNAEYRWKSGTNSQRTLETRRAYVLQISSALFPGVTVAQPFSASVEIVPFSVSLPVTGCRPSPSTRAGLDFLETAPSPDPLPRSAGARAVLGTTNSTSTRPERCALPDSSSRS